MGYLVAAFVALWLLVLIYVIYMAARQRSLERDVKQLEEALQERQRPEQKR